MQCALQQTDIQVLPGRSEFGQLLCLFDRLDSIDFSSYFWQGGGRLKLQIVVANELCSVSQVLNAVLAFSQSM